MADDILCIEYVRCRVSWIREGVCADFGNYWATAYYEDVSGHHGLSSRGNSLSAYKESQ
jgi:hypothetical protein